MLVPCPRSRNEYCDLETSRKYDFQVGPEIAIRASLRSRYLLLEDLAPSAASHVKWQLSTMERSCFRPVCFFRSSPTFISKGYLFSEECPLFRWHGYAFVATIIGPSLDEKGNSSASKGALCNQMSVQVYPQCLVGLVAFDLATECSQ